MIKLDKRYSDYTDETDVAAYPAGKAVDATTEESIDGTPYLKKWMNNIHGAFTALWVKAFGSIEGMSSQPDSVTHSDVLLAIEKLIERPLSLHSDTRSTNAHGATSAATPGQIVTRDQVGRAKVAVPVASDDIARKQEVDTEATARAAADAALQNGINTLIPAGMIIASPLANVSNFLPCNGGQVSRADFPKLNSAMAAIGYPYGAGNGSTTFMLPPFNTQGAFLRGRGGSNAAGIGKDPQGDAIRNIVGSVYRISETFNWDGSADGVFGKIGGYGAYGTPKHPDHGDSSSFNFDASRYVGANHVANENRPINHAIYWHIKY